MTIGSTILVFSIYENIISLLFGLITLYLAVFFIQKFIINCKLIEIVESKNIALSIFFGALMYSFLSLTILIQLTVVPMLLVLKVH